MEYRNFRKEGESKLQWFLFIEGFQTAFFFFNQFFFFTCFMCTKGQEELYFLMKVTLRKMSVLSTVQYQLLFTHFHFSDTTESDFHFSTQPPYICRSPWYPVTSDNPQITIDTSESNRNCFYIIKLESWWLISLLTY